MFDYRRVVGYSYHTSPQLLSAAVAWKRVPFQGWSSSSPRIARSQWKSQFFHLSSIEWIIGLGRFDMFNYFNYNLKSLNDVIGNSGKITKNKSICALAYLCPKPMGQNLWGLNSQHCSRSWWQMLTSYGITNCENNITGIRVNTIMYFW